MILVLSMILAALRRHLRRARGALGTLLVVALLAPACSGGQQADPRESFPTALRDFHSHLMWGRYYDAAGYLPEGQRDVFVGQHEEIGDDIRFTEYEVGGVDIDPEAEEVTVVVTLSYYRVPSYTIQETQVRETWQYDEESEYWWLVERSDPEQVPVDEQASQRRY